MNEKESKTCAYSNGRLWWYEDGKARWVEIPSSTDRS